MRIRTLAAALLLHTVASADDLATALARVGTWDGHTESASLAGPYEDALQQAIPFGRRSYQLAPWRAYMDTRPASWYLGCLGINFNVNRAEQQEPVATLLAEAGMRTARVEVGWGSYDYNDPDHLPKGTAERLARTLRILKAHGLRPLVLLNANSGWPCPIRGFRVKAVAAAEPGARELVVDKTAGIVPERTGLRGHGYQIAFPLITAVDAATGRCTLSAPLKARVPAGNLDLYTLRYAPFGGEVNADGTPNPALAETIDGWRRYVASLLAFCRDGLASGTPADSGFDVEVWNELTFGSQFLEDKNYWVPARTYRQPWTYTNWGRTNRGFTNLLCLTADYVAAPSSGLPGVRVITGFSNQWPWDSGTEMWPTQTGFSRHFYTGTAPSSPDDPKVGTLCAETLADRDKKSGPLNALGLPDGTPDGKDWHTVLPGTFFVPVHRSGLPERWLFGYQTEFMVRDLQPFPGPWSAHHRFGHPGTGRSAEVWQTEFNCDRSAFIDSLVKQGVPKSEPRLHELAQWLGAKVMLRSFAAYAHKGLKVMTVFAAQGSDFDLGVLPEGFFKALAASKGELTPEVRALAGPQVTTLGRVTRLLAGAQPLPETRPLRVTGLVEHQPRLVFAGNGTPANPDRYQRDDFAVLPYQLAAGRYAVAFYVMARDVTHVWDAARDRLDPRRYTMPDQRFDLTLANLRGTGLRASVYDPVDDSTRPVQVLAADATSATLALVSSDSPRWLLLDESAPGPLVESPSVRALPTGTRLSFTPNVAGQATVSWGFFPVRRPAGLLAESFGDRALTKPVGARREPNAEQRPTGEGALRLSGRLVPPRSGPCRLTVDGADGWRLLVDGRTVLDHWRNAGRATATVELTAGQAVPLTLEQWNGTAGGRLSLRWQFDQQSESVVPVEALLPAGPLPEQARTLAVRAGVPVTLDLPVTDARDAVRVTLVADGLSAPWPRWDWDTAGVPRFPAPVMGAGASGPGAKLPPLPAGARPSDCRLPFETRRVGDVVVTLRRLVVGEAEAAGVLPVTAPGDEESVTAVTWSGAAAWRADYRLDPTAHPGETQLAQRLWLAPLKSGLVVLSAGGSREALERAAAELEALAATVGFTGP